MTVAENKAISWIQKHVLLLFVIFGTIAGLAMCWSAVAFESGDFYVFLEPWWNEFKTYGFQGLAREIGNYNLPYQILIALMINLPIEPIYAYKGLSVIFDFLLSGGAALIVMSLAKNNVKLKGAISYFLTFCCITVVFNSGFWSQCDSIYTSFIIFAVYFLIKEKHIPSFVCLGLAFGFKLQAVFILPAFFIYYIMTKKYSILHFLIIPAVDFIMCIPAFLMGRPIWDMIGIYLKQTNNVQHLQENCPNFYALLCDGVNESYYAMLKTFTIVLTFLILGMGYYIIIHKNVNLNNYENFIMVAIWTIFTCIMFLTSMHERYTYVMDVLTIILAAFTFRRIWLPLMCISVSMLSYCHYLFYYDALNTKVVALIYLLTYLYYTFVMFRDLIKNKTDSPVNNNLILKRS